MRPRFKVEGMAKRVPVRPEAAILQLAGPTRVAWILED
jgi:hypothetical protein